MKVLRSLYNNNPFYLVSALMVLFGLKAVFPSGDSPSYDWVVMGLLVSYISLLALTATVIIRAGSVWEDARSILLVIAFLIVALSVNADEKVIGRPWTGSALLLGGLLFSLAVSKVVLVGLRIRLLPLYRLPFYLLIGGFFAYPLFLTLLLRSPKPESADWGVLGFPLFFGLCLLSLLPAVRRGPDYVKDNGTPWRWPWFPWLLFAVLVLCAGGRSYYFSLSFGMGKGTDSTFAPYFLAPIALAVSVLFLEAGLAGRSRRARRIALGIPLALPAICPILPATRSAAWMPPGSLPSARPRSSSSAGWSIPRPRRRSSRSPA